MNILKYSGLSVVFLWFGIVPGAFSQEVPVEPQGKVSTMRAPGIDRPLYLAQFYAPSIDRETKYMALLPANYDDASKRFPVLYLLHGFSQNYTVWPMLGVPEYTKDMELIVVFPDAGNSWFIDWAQSDGGRKNDWETFIVEDIIQHVDATFRTIPDREGRAVGGLSMGGFGALALGLRHPDVFCSVASHSGALRYARNACENLEAGAAPAPYEPPEGVDTDKDADVPEAIAIPGFTRQSERYPKGIAFLSAEDCHAYDPFRLVLEVPRDELPDIYLDCGLQDSLLASSREFMALLLANEIPFTYAEAPGGHRPSYWVRQARQAVAVQYATLQRRLAE